MLMATTRSGGDGGDLDGSVGIDTVSREYSIKYIFFASVGFFLHVLNSGEMCMFLLVETFAAVCNEDKLSFKINK